MGLLVKMTEVREFMNSPRFAAPQEQAAERAIKGLEGQLRTYLRTSLVPEDRTERLWVDSQGYATVKNSPINSVTSVTVDPDGVVDVSGYGLTGPFKVWGNSVYVGVHNAHQHVLVTYNGGPDHRNNEDMRYAIMTVAARALAPRHDEGRTVNGLQTDQRDENANPQRLPPRFTDDELEQFTNHRRATGL